MSQICSKMFTFLLTAYFGDYLCYHSNGKCHTNTKKVVIGDFHFLVSWEGGKISLNVRSSLFGFLTNCLQLCMLVSDKMLKVQCIST